MELRQILRKLSKTYKGRTKMREILARFKHKLTKNEFWVIEYTYTKEEPIDYVCKELGFSNTLYHSIQNTALSKLEILIDDTLMREIIKII
jgi:DNA-directed RNA polymerase specialized sigma subunit